MLLLTRAATCAGADHLAVVAPSAFNAWMLPLRDYGAVKPDEVLAPAIGYAESGFAIVHTAAASIHAIADHFRAY